MIVAQRHVLPQTLNQFKLSGNVWFETLKHTTDIVPVWKQWQAQLAVDDVYSRIVHTMHLNPCQILWAGLAHPSRSAGCCRVQT